MQDAVHSLVEETLSLEQQVDALKRLQLDHVTPDDLVAAVEIFRRHMHKVDLGDDEAVDLVGTGGDKSNTFNISTTAAFLAIKAGVKLAKHGNVATSSKSGAFDLLAELGTEIPETPEAATQYFRTHNHVFLFAKHYHPAFAKFAEARKVLAQDGVITLFNILGPLLHPAEVKQTVVGVFRADLVPLMAETLLRTGTKRGLIVHGNGMDELSLTGLNIIAEIKNGDITNSVKNAEDFDLSACKIEDLEGGDPAHNAEITRSILAGEATQAQRDTALLNAAAALYVSKDISFSKALNILQEETGI